MKKINSFFKYVGYLATSLFLGWLSTQGETDFVSDISKYVITILLALLSIYVALSGQIMAELYKLTNRKPEVVGGDIVMAMKRNVIIELCIIAVALVSLTICSPLQSWLTSCKNLIQIFVNTIVVFAIIYFMIVIYDSFHGLFSLIKFNNSDQ